MKKKKNDLRKINNFLNQKLKKETFKNRFPHLIKRRPTAIHKIKKHTKRSDVKVFLKQEISNYNQRKE